MKDTYGLIFNVLDQEISHTVQQHGAWAWEEQCRSQAALLAQALAQAFDGNDAADVVERTVVAARMLAVVLLRIPRKELP